MSVASEFSLEGQVAVVTGAAGLIGRHHCEALRDAGAIVVLVDMNQTALDAAAADLAKGGGRAPLAVKADITSEADLNALRDTLRSTYSRIDVLVNNGAINDKVETRTMGVEATKFENFPLEEWRRVIDVNTTGVFLPSRILGADMAAAGRGSIINVSSTYGLVGPDQSLYVKPDGTRTMYKSPAYPTSKGAVLAFTRFLAAYWGPAGVRVNTLVPGGVEAGQEEWFLQNYGKRTPLGRMAQPDDYRGALLFLASDASRYVTGSTVVVDGGFTAW